MFTLRVTGIHIIYSTSNGYIYTTSNGYKNLRVNKHPLYLEGRLRWSIPFVPRKGQGQHEHFSNFWSLFFMSMGLNMVLNYGLR